MNASAFSSHPAKYICGLPDSASYFESDSGIDIDDDGDPLASLYLEGSHRIPAGQHQEETSYGGVPSQPEACSAFLHEYIVLPRIVARQKQSRFEENEQQA